MRLSLWLILIFAFSVGMGCALVIRWLYFEAQPVATQTSEPRMKILVATQTIPSGVEITADLVAFQDVPLSEIPAQALTDFADVYRRPAAYPIPVDCPICEDLLLPRSESATQAAFIPVGSQFVTFDVEHIRQGDRVFSPTQPLSTVLAADQRIDIWVISHMEAHGRFAEMKNEVLRSHAAQELQNSGQLLLENVPIHQIQRRTVADQAGSIKDSLMVLLDKTDGTRLTAAAKKGHIQIHLRRNEETAPQQELETAVAEQPQDICIEVPVALEQAPEQPLEPRKLASTSSPESITSIVPVPMPEGIFEAMLPPVANPAPDPFATHAPVPGALPDGAPLPVIRELRNFDSPEKTLSANSQPEKLISIRNDAPVNSFVGVPRRVGSTDHSLLQPPDSATVVGVPRVTNAIQFVSPEQVASAQESARRPEVSAPPPALPLAVSTPPRLIDKKNVPEYSPFEQRRVYTVLPSNNSEESSEVLHSPPRLWRSSNVGNPTE